MEYYDNPYQSEYWEAIKKDMADNDKWVAKTTVFVLLAIFALLLILKQFL